MSTDLRAQLDEAVRARLAVAKARNPGLLPAGPVHIVNGAWTTEYALWLNNSPAAFIVLTQLQHEQLAELLDPATVILMCERDLRVLERHVKLPDSWGSCAWCRAADPRGPSLVGYPCPEVRDLAVAYGLDPTAGE